MIDQPCAPGKLFRQVVVYRDIFKPVRSERARPSPRREKDDPIAVVLETVLVHVDALRGLDGYPASDEHGVRSEIECVSRNDVVSDDALARDLVIDPRTRIVLHPVVLDHDTGAIGIAPVARTDVVVRDIAGDQRVRALVALPPAGLVLPLEAVRIVVGYVITDDLDRPSVGRKPHLAIRMDVVVFDSGNIVAVDANGMVLTNLCVPHGDVASLDRTV